MKLTVVYDAAPIMTVTWLEIPYGSFLVVYYIINSEFHALTAFFIAFYFVFPAFNEELCHT